jgi:hypothetical protein
VDPRHDGIELLDIGTVISGLTPALSISVEPSGIVPPFKVKVGFAPMDESGEAMPVDAPLAPNALVEAQAEAMVEPNPPPSKTEPATGVEAMADPLSPVMPEDIPEYAADPLVLQFEIGAGLKPPGSISVEPSGIPVALFDPAGVLEPRIPSGDVAPMPELVIVPAPLIALCAWAAPQPNRIAATMRGESLMGAPPLFGGEWPSSKKRVLEEGRDQ